MSKLKFAIALLFPLLPFFSFGQIENTSFPKSWEGKWSGTLEVFRDTGKVQDLPMELHILPIDTASKPSWTWTIIYGEDKTTGIRPYELITLDVAKGQYLIDEKNTIQIEAYFLGGQFYQWFEVQGSRLLTKTEMQGKSLVWEIVVSGNEPVNISGKGIYEGEEVPPVSAFKISTLQRAVLKRI